MKFYDKNGNVHGSMINAAISDIRANTTNVVIPAPKQKKLDTSHITLRPEVGKSIKIDREKNKVYLVDDLDNVLAENDIDPKLVVRASNDFIDIESIDPRLLEPEFIDKALNGDKMKSAIDKGNSINVNN